MLIFVVAVVDGRVLGEDRDAALALEVVRVHDALAVLLVGAEDAALLQQGVDEGGLAVVDVGDDGDVAEVHAGLRAAPRAVDVKPLRLARRSARGVDVDEAVGAGRDVHDPVGVLGEDRPRAARGIGGAQGRRTTARAKPAGWPRRPPCDRDRDPRAAARARPTTASTVAAETTGLSTGWTRTASAPAALGRVEPGPDRREHAVAPALVHHDARRRAGDRPRTRRAPPRRRGPRSRPRRRAAIERRAGPREEGARFAVASSAFGPPMRRPSPAASTTASIRITAHSNHGSAGSVGSLTPSEAPPYDPRADGRKESCVPTRVIIMGAAGRDFHNFNTVFRERRGEPSRRVHRDPDPEHRGPALPAGAGGTALSRRDPHPPRVGAAVARPGPRRPTRSSSPTATCRTRP